MVQTAIPNQKRFIKAWMERHAGPDYISQILPPADKRAALVDYFRDEAAIMIATEAAAEGINLQFCNLVVNYDLPWNPNRIEQRLAGAIVRPEVRCGGRELPQPEQCSRREGLSASRRKIPPFRWRLWGQRRGCSAPSSPAWISKKRIVAIYSKVPFSGADQLSNLTSSSTTSNLK